MKTPYEILSSSSHYLNLSGSWEECITSSNTATQQSNVPSTEACHWKKRVLPSSVPTDDLLNQTGWVIYRANITTPNFCSYPENLCRLVIGEVGDAISLWVNGKAIGQHGGLPPNDRYARHYPVSIDISSTAMNPVGQPNVIQIFVRHLKKAQTGILRGPFAFVTPNVAIPAVQSLLFQNVLIPIVCGLGIFLIAALSWISLRLNRIRDPRLKAFYRYGFISAAFLLSYSSIPREYLPLALTGCVHFILRFAMDWTYFELMIAMTLWHEEIAKYVRTSYTILVCLLFISYLMDPWVAEKLNGLTGFNGAVKLSGWFDFPLVFGPYLYGMIAMITTRRSQRDAIVCLSIVTAALAFSGVLTFHGAAGFPHFVIFYPFFAVLMLGIDIWGDYLFTHETLKRDSEVGKMASQVAHDIRSPLAALNMVTSDLSELPEETRIIVRSAVGRIKDIANSLLLNNRINSESAETNTLEDASTQLLPAIIDELVTEKRMQYRTKIGVEIDYELGTAGYGIFAKIQVAEFKRVLSNLINNSVESFRDEGTVSLTLEGSETHTKLIVKDNGSGIPIDVLPRLMQRGETHGKKGGSGLGLYHARTTCEAWGGNLVVESEVAKGTSIIITLPRAPAPHWFVPKLVIAAESTVVVLDDDTSIHQIWHGRFERANFFENGIKVHHFSTLQKIESWMRGGLSYSHSTIFLFDYELIGEKTSGLALIEKFQIANQSILVTSRYDDKIIRETCKRLGVKLIPKGMTGFVPVEIAAAGIAEQTPVIDAVLIDDDEIVHMTWRMSAKQAGCRFLGFYTADEFFKVAETIGLETPIYIDSFLGKNSRDVEMRGEDVSLALSKMGFKSLYLATGLVPDHADKMTWLKAVRGKDAPFLETSFKKNRDPKPNG